MRTLPRDFASAIDPASTRSAKATTSALMNPRWKSVWMTPAAWGAVQPWRMVQARDSFGPAVRKLGVVSGLNALNAQETRELRAFLYSL